MRSHRKITWLCCFAAPLALAGCGGGSGGGGGPGGVTNEFVKFPIAANTPTKIVGKGREATFNSGGISAFVSGDVSADVIVDGVNEITSVALKSATNGTKTWNGDNAEMSTGFGDSADRILIGKSNDDNRAIGVGNPDSAENKFEYQTYGAWKDESAGKVGVFSVGAVTASGDVPTSGTATFKGTAGGLYHDGSDEDAQIMTAKAKLDVDFANAKANFKTTDTVLETGANDGLNMSTGDLDIANGGFSGAVSTVNGMNGNVDGRFYGTGTHAAEEVGGTFALTGGGATMAGGYGAVKQP